MPFWESVFESESRASDASCRSWCAGDAVFKANSPSVRSVVGPPCRAWPVHSHRPAPMIASRTAATAVVHMVLVSPAARHRLGFSARAAAASAVFGAHPSFHGVQELGGTRIPLRTLPAGQVQRVQLPKTHRWLNAVHAHLVQPSAGA